MIGTRPRRFGRDVPVVEFEEVTKVYDGGSIGLIVAILLIPLPFIWEGYVIYGKTFLVGMAASVGAGISMGFAEALSDDDIAEIERLLREMRK